jgi:16S rRNA (cytosine967-C5)-methyltransferase
VTPSARLAAAAEILDEITKSRHLPEIVLKQWGVSHRFAGSKDRRAIADRVYQVLRNKARLSYIMNNDSGRSLVIGALHLMDGLNLQAIHNLYSGLAYSPKQLSDEEISRLQTDNGENLPEWIRHGVPSFIIEDLKEAYPDDWAEELKALMQPRAPIDIRVKSDRVELAKGLEICGYNVSYTPFSSKGLRIKSDPPPNIRALPAFGSGEFEIQDEGSQILGFLLGARPGDTILDYCAGGGGKTLAILQSMEGRGRVIASDIDQTRLNNIKPRLKRAHWDAELRLLGGNGEGLEDIQGLMDRVMVDAPCSGTGVLRRHPETASQITQEEVEKLHETQKRIIHNASNCIRIGGLLAYATCSVLKRENEDVTEDFLLTHRGFKPFPITDALEDRFFSPEASHKLSELAKSHQLRLSPHKTQTDGFYIALFRRMD